MLLGLSERRKWISKAVAFAVAIPGLAFWCGSALEIRLNGSPSLPIGLYRVSPNPAADLIEFCPAEPFAALATARGYRRPGRCPDGGTPLLKPVVARAGDRVTVSLGGVAVNGVLLPNSAPRLRDTAGRPLISSPPGTYEVRQGTLWVVSTYESSSYDSRYFGAIDESQVLSRLRPFLVWR
jgi:conjugative transfer signal peptidase TraF